jgi:aspartate-semialdehyde dehydrogenase
MTGRTNLTQRPHFKHVAIVGATGAVGREFGLVLEQRRFPAQQYRLLASANSAGRTLTWCGRELPVETLRPNSFEGCDLALFSAGAAVSREFGPLRRARRRGGDRQFLGVPDGFGRSAGRA